MKAASKITNKQKEGVRKFLNDLQWMFGIQNYDRTIIFADLNEPNCPPQIAATIDIHEDYQRIIVTIYPDFWDGNKKQQREYLLHELCHFLTSPLSDVAENLLSGKLETSEHIRIANEKATSRTAFILDCLLSGKMKYAPKLYQKYLK